MSHDKSPEEAALLESRGAISSSALASSNGRSSNASRGTTNSLLQLNIGEHRPDRVENCNDSREEPKLAVRVEIVRVLVKLSDEQLSTDLENKTKQALSIPGYNIKIHTDVAQKLRYIKDTRHWYTIG